MTDNESEKQQKQRSSTSPPEETKDATHPPANQDVDKDAVDRGRTNYDKVSGH